jgi:hypothetical protein
VTLAVADNVFMLNTRTLLINFPKKQITSPIEVAIKTASYGYILGTV